MKSWFVELPEEKRPSKNCDLILPFSESKRYGSSNKNINAEARRIRRIAEEEELHFSATLCFSPRLRVQIFAAIAIWLVSIPEPSLASARIR
jgi:hypothetical protein